MQSTVARAFLHGLVTMSVVVAVALGLPSVSHAQPVEKATRSILVLGDSLSAAYGLARDAGWVNLLQDRLRKEKFDYQVVNASISGETVSGGNTRLPALLGQFQPAIVVIELGANDGLRGLQLSAAEQGLRKLIETSRKAQASVLLIGMRIPPNYGPDYVDRFYQLFGKLATEYRVAYLPFLLEGVGQNIEFFQADRLHPTAQAQPILLDNVWAKLKPLLR